MFSLRLINKIKPCNQCRKVQDLLQNKKHRFYCNKQKAPLVEGVEKKQNLGEMSSKYQVFRDEDSEVVLDIYEERLLKYGQALDAEPVEEKDPFDGLNLQRGLTGVFDIEDLVDVLKRENGQDIFVAKVPQEIKYVDYICIVSGKSTRHLQALAQFVRRVYKQKRGKGDVVPRLEGADSKEWMAIDLGNIALHIFSKQTREVYDLESLWTIGPKLDKECNKADPVADMLEKHTVYLRDLQPAS